MFRLYYPSFLYNSNSNRTDTATIAISRFKVDGNKIHSIKFTNKMSIVQLKKLKQKNYLYNMGSKLFTYKTLESFTKAVFRQIGCTEEHAEIATQTLLSADLRGIDSHGIARLTGYVRLWEVKRINARPDIKVIHETPSTAVVDGDGGLGLVVAPYAMKIAIEKAKKIGLIS